MHIGWVGGLDRNEAHFERMAAAAGHVIEWLTNPVVRARARADI